MKTKGKKAKKMPGVTNKKKNILSSFKIARWDEKGERELRGAIHFFVYRYRYGVLYID